VLELQNRLIAIVVVRLFIRWSFG